MTMAAVPVWAQESSGGAGLEEIIVTAQKREQSLQDVPIAVTALNTETLRVNRIANVADLSGLSPGLTVAPTSGAVKIPSFTLRGAVGNGSVAGSEKQVSTYLDGVYLSASRGAIFELPDIQRIEMLRGPQGTLFGRNATAGAVSITTRDPSGDVGVRASVSYGNYDQYRFMTSVDLPQVGPFSAYVSYLHNQRRGDIRNTAAGQLWDRRSSATPRLAKIERSPRYLGDENSDSFFAALKFESGDFTTVYKYDYLRAEGTPTGTALVGYNPAGATGNLITALIESQPFAVPIAADGKRPDAVANGFSVSVPQRAEGHSLTSTWQATDNISIRNVFGYRTSFIFGASPLDGFSGLIITPEALPALATLYRQPVANLAGLVGSPFVGIGNQSQARSKQLSDELQVNYTSTLMTATVGALWFNAKEFQNESLQPFTTGFRVLPGGIVTTTNVSRTFNEVTSLAAYAQLELHVTDKLDLVAGGRITRDKKTGEFTYGASAAALNTLPFSYKKSKPNYLIGVNYKPNRDILVYGKYSTAYVSGGSVVGIPYAPETAKSWELGIKSELFDRRLRANLSLFDVKYSAVQGAQSVSTPGSPEYIVAVTGDPTRPLVATTFLRNVGDIKARGFEFDFIASPVERFTLGGSLGYTHSKIRNVPASLIAANGGRYELTLRPEWTANAYAQYDTPAFGSGETHLSFRADARWQSDMQIAPNRDLPSFRTFAAGIREVPSYWVWNGRIALKNLDLGGVDTEFAVWGKNLSDNRSANYGVDFGTIADANFIPARTYGADLTIAF